MTEKQSAARTTDALADIRERRNRLMREELAAASAASDAKTARLRALRLERDRLQAAIVPAPQDDGPARARNRAGRAVTK